MKERCGEGGLGGTVLPPAHSSFVDFFFGGQKEITYPQFIVAVN